MKGSWVYFLATTLFIGFSLLLMVTQSYPDGSLQPGFNSKKLKDLQRRLVFLFLDGFSFRFGENTFPNRVKIFQDYAEQKPRQVFYRKSWVHPPTWTTHRLQSVLTGGLPSEKLGTKLSEMNGMDFEVLLDGFDSQTSSQRRCFFGDDIWKPLISQSKYGFTKTKYYDWLTLNEHGQTDENVVSDIIGDFKTNPADQCDFIVAHTSELDHNTHQYGLSSPQVESTLKRDQILLERLLGAIPKNVTLVITSDHGLKEDGHGGTSSNERLSLLFVYHPAYEVSATTDSDVDALDITPTISSLLGMSPPINSLGKPIDEIFASDEEKLLVQAEGVKQKLKLLQILRLPITPFSQNECFRTFSKNPESKIDSKSMSLSCEEFQIELREKILSLSKGFDYYSSKKNMIATMVVFFLLNFYSLILIMGQQDTFSTQQITFSKNFVKFLVAGFAVPLLISSLYNDLSWVVLSLMVILVIIVFWLVKHSKIELTSALFALPSLANGAPHVMTRITEHGTYMLTSVVVHYYFLMVVVCQGLYQLYSLLLFKKLGFELSIWVKSSLQVLKALAFLTVSFYLASLLDRRFSQKFGPALVGGAYQSFEEFKGILDGYLGSIMGLTLLGYLIIPQKHESKKFFILFWFLISVLILYRRSQPETSAEYLYHLPGIIILVSGLFGVILFERHQSKCDKMLIITIYSSILAILFGDKNIPLLLPLLIISIKAVLNSGAAQQKLLEDVSRLNAKYLNLEKIESYYICWVLRMFYYFSGNRLTLAQLLDKSAPITFEVNEFNWPFGPLFLLLRLEGLWFSGALYYISFLVKQHETNNICPPVKRKDSSDTEIKTEPNLRNKQTALSGVDHSDYRSLRVKFFLQLQDVLTIAPLIATENLFIRDRSYFSNSVLVTDVIIYSMVSAFATRCLHFICLLVKLD